MCRIATRGRPPKPTALKLLEGDRGKGRRPLNVNEPIPPQGGIKCPSWLLPEAKNEWKRLAPTLEAIQEMIFGNRIDENGVLMIPKTMAYVWTVWIGFSDMRKTLAESRSHQLSRVA